MYVPLAIWQTLLELFIHGPGKVLKMTRKNMGEDERIAFSFTKAYGKILRLTLPLLFGILRSCSHLVWRLHLFRDFVSWVWCIEKNVILQAVVVIWQKNHAWSDKNH